MTSITELDLDISNYKLNDILNLFNLSHDFNNEDLKCAYKQTLMTHPDKSGLDKEYFLFFSKAFKKIKYLYDYRKKHIENDKCPKDVIYSANISNTQEENDEISRKIKDKLANASDFNEKFNALFEKVKIHDDEHDNGYDEWMKHNQKNDDNVTINNVRSLNEYIEKKKEEVKSLIEYTGVQEMNSSGNIGSISNLKREKPKYYESGLFSKMQYDDYKRAHSETVVPVTYDDYLNKKRFNNVNELQNFRKNNEATPSLEQTKQFMEEKRRKDYEESVSIAYDLTQQMENIKKSNEKWNAHFKLLMNGTEQ